VAPRLAHRPRAGGGETQAPKVRRNVVLLRLRRPIRDKSNGYLRFAALATKPGEKSGLGRMELPISDRGDKNGD